MQVEQYVTQAEYARMRGVKRQYINKMVRKGTIKAADDKRINAAQADQALNYSQDPVRQLVKMQQTQPNPDTDAQQLPLPTNPPQGDSLDNDPLTHSNLQNYSLHRAQREKYAAMNAELEYQEKTGSLVKRAAVEQEVFKTLRELRNRLNDIPTNVSAQLVSMTSEREIMRLLEDTINVALAETADAITAEPAIKAAPDE